MTLKKQSIRKNMHITENGQPVSKEVLINRSEDWNEIQENLFRKMLKQGGNFAIGGRKFFIIPNGDNRSLM